MASERSHVALFMRRGGAKYFQIAHHLHVSDCRARQLVSRALAEEARQSGGRLPTQDALDSIRKRRVQRQVH